MIVIQMYYKRIQALAQSGRPASTDVRTPVFIGGRANNRTRLSKIITLYFYVCIILAAGKDPRFEVAPKEITVAAGGASIQYTVTKGKDANVDPATLKFTFDPPTVGDWNLVESFDKAKLQLSLPANMPKGIELILVSVTVTGEGSDKDTALVHLAAERTPEWESRAIAGYHQAGASSSDFVQNFFFDFFAMRGLGNYEKVYEANWNLWGNVRIASSPQQVTTPVAEFAVGVGEKIGKLKVNELAQSAEFQAGLERKIRLWNQGGRKRMLGFVGFLGASGGFTNPTLNSSTLVYKRPGDNDPQYTLFHNRYPTATTSLVGFVPPDRQRFYRQYGGGLRLSTFDTNAPYAPPGTFLLTIGQDESITGGRFHGATGRIDVFYPLPVGKRDGRYKFLFLFATGSFAFSKDGNETPLALEKAVEGDNKQPVPLYDKRVSIVTIGSSRDTYRIGVGIDFVNLLSSWLGPK